MTRPLKFVSLFAGVGGFDLGFERAGLQCVGQCEIDPHAVAVLKHHWPDVPKHHDVSTLDGMFFGPADVITFGSPCQDLSVAGKRRGLKGERSSLFLQAVRYIREMQEATNGEFPRFAVWENVPGAFSSNEGRDFAAVLASLVGGEVRCPPDGWSNAGIAFGPDGSAEWRTLDSRYFGVAQRRRRIFLVYNPRGDRAGSVLFEPDGVRRYSASRRGEGKDPTPRPEGGPRGDHREDDPDPVKVPVTQYGETAGTLTARGDSSPAADQGQNVVAFSHKDDGSDATVGLAPTLRSHNAHKGNQATGGIAVAQCLTTGTGQRYDPETETLVPADPPLSFNWQNWSKDGENIKVDEAGPLVRGQVKAVVAPDVADTLTVGANQTTGFVGEAVAAPEPAEPTMPALNSMAGRTGTNDFNTSGGLVPVAFQQNTRDEVRMMDGDGQVVGALAASPGAKQQNYLAQVPPQMVRTKNLRDDKKGEVWLTEHVGALQAIGDTPNQMQAVWQEDPTVFEPGSIAREAGPAGEQGIAPTLRDDPGDNRPAARIGQLVRRLTPVECERLQGFPDGHTAFGQYADGPYGTQEVSDTQRYRQMGNAVTVNVVEWIALGIAEALGS